MIRNLKAYVVKALLLTGMIFFSTTASAMTDINGKPENLARYVGKGQWVVVEAWHSRCTICMKGMPAMVQANGSFPNTRLVGISLDGNRVTAQGIISRFNINFPTLVTNISEFDQYLRRVAKRSLKGAPTYLIFSPTGELKAVQSGKLSPKDIHGYLRSQQ